MELLPEQNVAIFAAAPVKMMTDVVPYPFRQDADYLYITGCHQPGGVAVLGHDFGLVMFMPQLSTHVCMLLKYFPFVFLAYDSLLLLLLLFSLDENVSL